MTRNYPQDIEGEFTLLQNGGRRTPVFSGYKPTHRIHENYLTCGLHQYIGQNEIKLGQTASARVWFLSPQGYPNCLWVNRIIDVTEGPKIIGKLKITKILNEILIVEKTDYTPLWVKPEGFKL